jgi:hypothetical protein
VLDHLGGRRDRAEPKLLERLGGRGKRERPGETLTVAPDGAAGLVVTVRDGFMALDPGLWRASHAGRGGTGPAREPDERWRLRPGRPLLPGTMADDERPAAGTLYRFNPDLSVTTILTGNRWPGLAWTR